MLTFSKLIEKSGSCCCDPLKSMLLGALVKSLINARFIGPDFSTGEKRKPLGNSPPNKDIFDKVGFVEQK